MPDKITLTQQLLYNCTCVTNGTQGLRNPSMSNTNLDVNLLTILYYSCRVF